MNVIRCGVIWARVDELKQKATLEAQIIEPTEADEDGQLTMAELLGGGRVVQDGEAGSR